MYQTINPDAKTRVQIYKYICVCSPQTEDLSHQESSSSKGDKSWLHNAKTQTLREVFDGKNEICKQRVNLRME